MHSRRPPELRLRLSADTASVPGARQFVADGLVSWGHTTLVDDASLCVTELTANAALHSASTFMEVVVHDLGDAVRISVEDDGMIPAAAVTPRADFPGPDVDRAVVDLEREPTTGRGLAIVSILAGDWGVEQTDRGKRIWVDLVDSEAVNQVRPPTSRGTLPEGPGVPDGWHLVRLTGCPVQLSLRQDQHLDELIRELQLIDTNEDNLPPREIAELIDSLLRGQAHARHVGRAQGQQAAAAGHELVDVEMALATTAAEQVQLLHQIHVENVP